MTNEEKQLLLKDLCARMTEEEYQEFGYDVLRYTPREFDWLLAHHFDFRGLIPMGLALEAPKDMYNF